MNAWFKPKMNNQHELSAAGDDQAEVYINNDMLKAIDE